MFLRAMRVKSAVGVKMVILATGAFAAAMTIALVVEMTRDIRSDETDTTDFFYGMQMFLRVTFILAEFVMVIIFKDLWAVYRTAEDPHFQLCSARGVRIVFLCVWFIFVFVAIGAAFAPENGALHTYVWDAFAPAP